MEKIRKILSNLPDNPGVYQMFSNKKIIYIGKAKNLKKRVTSYFRPSTLINNKKTSAMVSKIDNIEWIITSSEVEALLLEENLIKKYKPRYNIDLKDGKRYPFICITHKETYPRIFLIHDKRYLDALYFGPFVSSGEIKDILEFLIEAYKLRTCKHNLDLKKLDRACLLYDIGKCSAPCMIEQKKEYKKSVLEIIEIFKGNYRNLEIQLKKEMIEASGNSDFEKAIIYRDRLNAVSRLLKLQSMHNLENSIYGDYIGCAVKKSIYTFVVVRVRNGKVVGRVHKSFQAKIEEDFESIVENFYFQFYSNDYDIPKRIVISKAIVDYAENIKNIFKTLKNVINLVIRPQKKEAMLVKMASDNASMIASQLLTESFNYDNDNFVDDLQELLGLKKRPERIEGFDIAHFQGKQTVASCVVFIDGKSSKKDYRKFEIKTVDGISDFASMEEVVSRRLSHIDDWGKPDLLLIDGGKGQLSSVLKILKEFDLDDEIELCSLAKREEEIFVPYQKSSILLPNNNTVKRVFMQIRDEAHRFCNTYHKNKRAKEVKSDLINVKGIGEKRLRFLYKDFKSIDRMKALSLDELQKLDYLDKKVAEILFNYLRKN